eukprot:scaffold8828_cov204-Amphora_coffeaeformis.AAC.38
MAATSFSSRLFLSVLLSAIFLVSLPSCEARVTCATTLECESTYLTGSRCVEGLCTNPFQDGGCLRHFVPNWHKTRVCHSGDPPTAMVQGHCRPAPYREVRIASQNWESAFFGTWILQILLSEILEVPVTVETGVKGASVDFYDTNLSMDYGTSNDFEACRTANQLGGDCQLASNMTGETYRACAHVIPEMWQEELVNERELVKEAVIEPSIELGALAGQYWFVPKFTVQRDPSLLSYTGLQGEGNRQKMADTFKRPTTWKAYCQEVSETQCTVGDSVATRPPFTPEEESSMFVQGLYNGYFRATEKNDCVSNPFTCTGHISDYPCGWNSFVKQQTHHLNIALESNGDEPSDGYTYAQLTQIWAAANATKSDVVMLWWNTEALYETYMGTDAEFTRVVLPPPTQRCFDSRANPADRCGDNDLLKIGSPEGACDTSPQSLQIVVATSFHDVARDPDIPPELWSPAYDAVLNYRISELQLGSIFEGRLQVGTGFLNYDFREATCRWVAENLDQVMSFVPEGFPRVVEHQDVSENAANKVAMGLASFALLLVCLSIGGIIIRRKTREVYHAQLSFMLLFLTGYLLISVRALFLAQEVTQWICQASPFIGISGYALVLVPVVTRVDAVNQLSHSGKQLQRVRLRRNKLFRHALLALVASALYFVIWSILDPMEIRTTYSLTNNQNEFGEAIVSSVNICDTEGQFWMTIVTAAHAAVILYCIILTVMASRAHQDINTTRNFSALVCILFIAVLVRLALLLARNSIKNESLLVSESLVLSAETILVLLAFVAPKLLVSNKKQDDSAGLPELFLRTSIMHASIVGFEKWSSSREPVQRKNVTKIETVGDIYVAATGIPRERADHAVAIARFAMECVAHMHRLTHELDVKYGPDTTDLKIQIGISSGPATGGFIAGSRFQLFGDTVNLASGMQATGSPSRIHISHDTAALLKEAGKERWIEERNDMVEVGYRGRLKTFWLRQSKKLRAPSEGDSLSDTDQNLWEDFQESNDRQQRLIEWNTQTLEGIVKQIIARRNASSRHSNSSYGRQSVTVSSGRHSDSSSCSNPQNESDPSTTSLARMPLDEVKEVIKLPEFNRRIAKRQIDADDVELTQDVRSQLQQFVAGIASMYKDNPFHCFAHASHVVMSMLKYMSRIVDSNGGEEEELSRTNKAATMHDNTYGITSDPLTHFACIFSALVHDADHPGVPNPQLIKENAPLAAVYFSRSVAEQNSFDLAWNLFIQDSFSELRNTICATPSELSRFRSLVINAVMATDLGDKELKELRNGRWEKAFNKKDSELAMTSDELIADRNRKATIVIEHLIQASDVSHTMQHWQVYREWNERLFEEMYAAYHHGRAERNPAEFWFEGEIGFFDFYIIPLSKKLKECGVFGVSSDENLNYALENRRMWVSHGREVVAEFVQKAESRHGVNRADSVTRFPAVGEAPEEAKEEEPDDMAA